MRETRIPLPCSRLIDTQTQTGTLAAGSCENPSDRCHTLRTGRLETGLDFRLRFSWPQFLPLISVVLHCTRVEGSCHLVIGRRIVIPAIDINWYLSISPSLKATQRRMKIKQKRISKLSNIRVSSAKTLIYIGISICNIDTKQIYLNSITFLVFSVAGRLSSDRNK